MANSATHSGHCQACGRLQKLPKDVLSKHGYTIRGGFFSGVCRGAGYKPFEKSCDQVKRYIGEAQSELRYIEAFIADLRKPATAETGMWVNVRYENPKGRYFKAIYKWEQVALRAEFRAYSSGDGGSQYYTFTDASGREHNSGINGGMRGLQAWDLADVREDWEAATTEECRVATVERANKAYAEYIDKYEATSLRRYIAWQQERVANWKEADCLPVNAKSKQGFVPTEAPY